MKSTSSTSAQNSTSNTHSKRFSNCPLSVLVSQAPNTPLILTEEQTFTAQMVNTCVNQLCTFFTKQQTNLNLSKTFALQFTAPSILYLSLIIALYRLKIRTAFINPRTPPATVQKNLQELLKTSTLLSDNQTSTLPYSTLEAIFNKWSIHTHHHNDISLENPTQPIPINSDIPLHILFTSASTHHAKAVVYTFAQHLQAATVSNEVLNFDSHKSWYLSLPLYHISGLGIWMRVLAAGAKIYLDSHPSFSPRAMLDSILKHSITHLSLVPAQLQKLLTYKDAEDILKRCEVILLGGGPIPNSFWSLCKKLPLVMSYGMSETLAHVALHIPKTSSSRAYTVLPSKQVKIEKNHIYIGKATLAQGYLETSGKIAFPLTADGFFFTGDRGDINDLGNKRELRVWGRASNSLTSGGETFQCEEIETVIYDNLNKLLASSSTDTKTLRLRGVYVLGVPNEIWGEVPVALLDFIKNPSQTPLASYNYKLDSNELSALSSLLKTSHGLPAYLKNHLEAYKHPKAYYVLNQGADQVLLKPYFTADSLSHAKLSRPLLRKLLNAQKILKIDSEQI